MSGYGPIVGSGNRRSRPFSLQDESEDPLEFDLRTPPKSPRPKSGSVSPRSGAPAMESSSDSYRATVPMLSRAQGDVNGPAQGVLGPPARPPQEDRLSNLHNCGPVGLLSVGGFYVWFSSLLPVRLQAFWLDRNAFKCGSKLSGICVWRLDWCGKGVKMSSAFCEACVTFCCVSVTFCYVSVTFCYVSVTFCYVSVTFCYVSVMHTLCVCYVLLSFIWRVL
jgi:hypothetical protein